MLRKSAPEMNQHMAKVKRHIHVRQITAVAKRSRQKEEEQQRRQQHCQTHLGNQAKRNSNVIA